MSSELVGESMFRVDGDTSVIIYGGLNLRSDGKQRSEIEVTDLRTGTSETMTFTGGNRWLIVHQLILLIREQFSTHSVEGEAQSESFERCDVCVGLGMIEDDEGNWIDCKVCTL